MDIGYILTSIFLKDPIWISPMESAMHALKSIFLRFWMHGKQKKGVVKSPQALGKFLVLPNQTETSHQAEQAL